MPKSRPVRLSGTPVSCQTQVWAHTSITPGWPSQTKVTLKQHEVPGGTLAAAATLIHPVQFGGTGFGAGVKSSLSSVAVKPGHRPAIDHVAPAEALQKTSVWTWLDPVPGRTSSPVK